MASIETTGNPPREASTKGQRSGANYNGVASLNERRLSALPTRADRVLRGQTRCRTKSTPAPRANGYRRTRGAAYALNLAANALAFVAYGAVLVPVIGGAFALSAPSPDKAGRVTVTLVRFCQRCGTEERSRVRIPHARAQAVNDAGELHRIEPHLICPVPATTVAPDVVLERETAS